MIGDRGADDAAADDDDFGLRGQGLGHAVFGSRFARGEGASRRRDNPILVRVATSLVNENGRREPKINKLK